MSPGRDQDYLCEGLAEELITALRLVDGLRVAARTASSRFRGAAADVRAVGRQLGVGALLEGILRAERVLELNPRDGRALSLGSLALCEDGQHARAMEWSRRSLELDADDMSALINAACLHSRAGQKEDALQFLERVFARGWGKRDWIEHDPDYYSLRDDPRFQRLLAKLK